MTCYSLVKNNQARLKISIACADLLIGFIYFLLSGLLNLFYLFDQSISLDKLIEITSMSNDTFSIYSPAKIVYYYDVYHKRIIIDILAISMHLSLFVSIYTLCVASVDRFLAIAHPLKYMANEEKAERYTKYAIVIIWILAVAISLLPKIIPDLEFYVLSNVPIIILRGCNSLIFISGYIIVMALPVITIWVMSIKTFCAYKKQGGKTLQITSNMQELNRRKERRLARTLSYMVGAFTISVIPVVLITIFRLTIPQINPLTSIRNKDFIGTTACNSLQYVTCLMSGCNSLWNVFVYNRRNDEFRHSFRKFIRKIISFIKR